MGLISLLYGINNRKSDRQPIRKNKDAKLGV
jgi:hypothetical protein